MSDLKMFARLDGTKRSPRSVQETYLQWLEEHWSTSSVFVGQLPTGVGKSFLARSIQLATNAVVITPSNILIDQYLDTYSKVNYLKGKTHFTCKWQMSCREWADIMEQPPCEGCPYQKAREAAIDGAPTFYNPMSFYYLRAAKKINPSVIVVDEAHQLAGMMLMMCSKRFRKSVYKFTSKVTDTLVLVDWMKDQQRKLRKLLAQYIKHKDYNRLSEINDEIEGISATLKGVEEDPQNYAIWIDRGMHRGKPETFLNVKPLRPPAFIVDAFLRCDKLILMSGTMLKHDIDDLLRDRTYQFIDLPSPIPKENRPVYCRPVPFRMNYQTDPRLIAEAIECIIAQNYGLNTIIHTTYSMSPKLRPHMRTPVIFNTAIDKVSRVEEFKQKGGVFLAAGCAEGLDLKDALCRINVVPKLSYPDLNDPVVGKRRALEDGELWYALESLKNVIQQTGRSTRNEADWSRTYVLDPMFPRLIGKYGKYLPRSFTESIVWTV